MVNKTRQKIELSANKKAEIAKTFGVTGQFVSLSLLYRRNSPQAAKIRAMALAKGGSLLRITDITDELKREVKELDAKGNVIRTIKE